MNKLQIAVICGILGVENPSTFSAGFDDGKTYGFNIPIPLVYSDPAEQWDYEVGCHIGALIGTRP